MNREIRVAGVLSLCRSAVATLAVFGVLAGCDKTIDAARNATESDTPFVVVVDSVILQEASDSAIGSAAAVAIDASGRIYVADGSAGLIAQFSRSGERLRTFGRNGRGPGELLSPNALAVIGDSVLVASDARNRKLVFFDTRSGATLRELPNVGLVTALAVGPDALLLGRLDAAGGSTAALLLHGSRTIVSVGALPVEYVASTLLASIQPYVAVAFSDTVLVVGAAGARQLVFLNRSAAAFDSLEIPATTRRGIPRDMVERLNTDAPMETKAAIASSLMTVGPLSGDWLGLVHFDYSVSGDTVSARPYLSIVDWRRRIACIDFELHVISAGLPRITVWNDMFVVIHQRVESSGRVAMQAHYLRVDRRRCGAF